MGLTEAQVKAHNTGLGGSDGAAILGVSPYRTALDVWLDKTGRSEPKDETKFMRMGNVLEPVVAKLYEEETKRTVLTLPDSDEPIRFTDKPHILGFPDRLVDDPARGPVAQNGVLEIKTTNAFRKSDWDDGTPIYYQVQLQHYLALMGRGWGSVAVLIGGVDFLYEDFEANTAFIESYIERLDRFWRDHVVADKPPKADPTRDGESIKRLYKGTSIGEVRLLAPAFDELSEQRDKIGAEILRLEKEKKAIDTMLREAIGEAEFGQTPAGFMYSLNTVRRAGYTVEAQEFRQLSKVKAKLK